MNKQEFAKVVQAWADGETIEYNEGTICWFETHTAPSWHKAIYDRAEYRIKPKDVIEHSYLYSCLATPETHMADVKLTYTNGKLTNAEVIE